MSEPVFVAGVGLIASIGNNVAECLSSFEAGKAGMEQIRYLQTSYRGAIPVAEVKLSNDELSQRSGLAPEISRTAHISAIAAKEALDDAGLSNLPSLRTGFISANTVGGMDLTEQFYPEFLRNKSEGHLRNVVNHGCGSISELVAGRLGINGYVTTINTACSSSANAIFFAARLIKHNMLDVAVAGGADSLTKFTLNGFNTLMILDRNECKPFDDERSGLNLGEGAGYIVLVSEKVMLSLNKQPYCRLSGYQNANDAYHQTASSPDGTGSYLAMTGALQRAGLRPGDIDYINLHGTGTQNNDFAEGTAVKRVFGEKYPPLSSTKSFTGHTLGASGGVEAVLSVLSVKHGMLYPNLRFQTPMHELGITPQTTFEKGKDIRHVLSNSFGFGGNCSSLIFSKA